MDSKNLIMGSIAIIVVVILGVLIFLPKNGANAVSVDLSDVEVFVHKEKTEETEGYYYPCSLSTEDLIKVKNEFTKAYKVNEESIVTGKSINGDYKVVVGEKFIAFDKENEGIMYLGSLNNLYSVESGLYNIVIKACN